MKLILSKKTAVFRRCASKGKPSRWHILEKASNNGFKKEDHPAWTNTQTYIGICGARIDSRYGNPEISQVENIRSICPSCWPYGKIAGNGNDSRRRHY